MWAARRFSLHLSDFSRGPASRLWLRRLQMHYLVRVLKRLTRSARIRYRYYAYWRSQEKMASECSTERLKEIQWARLNKLLNYAYERIPLYRDKFSEAGVRPDDIATRRDFRQIPVLTKDEIRQSFPDRILNGQRSFPSSMMGQTSGSTGDSLHFVRPDQQWQCSVLYSVLLRTNGLSNTPVMVFSTPHCTAATCSIAEDEESEDPPIGKFQRIRFLRHLDGEPIGLPPSENIMRASADYMERVRRIVSYFAPCLIIADPVYLGSFARYLRDGDAPVPALEGIISTYELLTPSLEELLRDVFGCPVYTQYGASEVPDIANECEHGRLHVRMNNVLVEVIRDGRPAEPGEVGKIVVTDLRNYNMPFIRYDIGDLAVRHEGPCECGRNTGTLGRIRGRARDVILTNGSTDGDVLTPLQADRVFHGVPGIDAYRLVQRTKHSYDISVMPNAGAETIDQQTIVNRSRDLLGAESWFNIRTVPEIKPERSMKFRFVYSELTGASL